MIDGKRLYQSNNALPPMRKWFTLGVLALLSSLLIGGTMVSFGVYITPLQADEGWPATSLGLAATLLLLSASVSGILGGFIIDRANQRIVLLLGGGISAFGIWLAGTAADIETFVLAMALNGTGLGLATHVTSVPIISSVFGDKRGIAFGTYFSALAFSAAALPPLVSLLITNIGWRATLHTTSALIVACTLLTLAIKSKHSAITSPSDALQASSPLPHTPPDHDIAPTKSAHTLPFKSAIQTQSFWALTLAMSLSLIAVQGVVFSTIPYFVEGGWGDTRAVNIFSLANMASVPALFLLGIVADRIGARKLLGIGLIVQALGTIALVPALSGSLIGWAATGSFITLWGISSGLPSQIGPMLLEDSFGSHNFGALLGINAAIASLAGAIAPLLTAWIHEITYGYASAFIFLTACILLGLPLLRIIKPHLTAAESYNA